jgi:hypothetical protein
MRRAAEHLAAGGPRVRTITVPAAAMVVAEPQPAEPRRVARPRVEPLQAGRRQVELRRAGQPQAVARQRAARPRVAARRQAEPPQAEPPRLVAPQRVGLPLAERQPAAQRPEVAPRLAERQQAAEPPRVAGRLPAAAQAAGRKFLSQPISRSLALASLASSLVGAAAVSVRAPAQKLDGAAGSVQQSLWPNHSQD